MLFYYPSGLSPDLQSMEQIRRIMRPTDVPDQGSCLLQSLFMESCVDMSRFFLLLLSCCCVCLFHLKYVYSTLSFFLSLPLFLFVSLFFSLHLSLFFSTPFPLSFPSSSLLLLSSGLLCDLLWADPDKETVAWGENDRGVSFTFGPEIVSKFLCKHDLDLICRAHQVQ